MNIVLATHNQNKVRELNAILGALGIEVTPLPQDFPDIEENGTTFEENALIKAEYVAKATGCAAFAAVLKRAVTARPAGGTFALWEGEGLTKRETALLASAAALLLLSMIVGG